MNRKVVLKVNFMIHWDAKPDNVQTLSDMSRTPRFPTPNRRQGSCFSKKRRGTRHTALPGMVRPGKTTRALEGQLSISSFQAILKIAYITLHYITLSYLILPYLTLHYITLHYLTLPYITLHYIHYINAISCAMQ